MNVALAGVLYYLSLEDACVGNVCPAASCLKPSYLRELQSTKHWDRGESELIELLFASQRGRNDRIVSTRDSA